MATDAELNDFLHRVDRLVEPALLFAPRVDAERVLDAIIKAFKGRFVFNLRANGPLAPDENEVEEVVRNSFDGRGVLAVVINDKPPAPVVAAVSRLLIDGVFAVKKDGVWKNLKPPEEWRMIVVADADSPDSLPGGLGESFPAVMAL